MVLTEGIIFHVTCLAKHCTCNMQIMQCNICYTIDVIVARQDVATELVQGHVAKPIFFSYQSNIRKKHFQKKKTLIFIYLFT